MELDVGTLSCLVSFIINTSLLMCSDSLLPGNVLPIRESLSSAAAGDPSHKGHVKEEGQGQEQDRKQTSLFRFFDTEDEVASRDVDFTLEQSCISSSITDTDTAFAVTTLRK